MWSDWQPDYGIHMLIALSLDVSGTSSWKTTFAYSEKLILARERTDKSVFGCSLQFHGIIYTGEGVNKVSASHIAARELLTHAEIKNMDKIMLDASGSIVELARSKYEAPFEKETFTDHSINGQFQASYSHNNEDRTFGPILGRKFDARKALYMKLLEPLWNNFYNLFEVKDVTEEVDELAENMEKLEMRSELELSEMEYPLDCSASNPDYALWRQGRRTIQECQGGGSNHF